MIPVHPQRVKRAARALVFDGWGWEFAFQEGGVVRARAFPTHRVRSYADGSVIERQALIVKSDTRDHALLRLAQLTGALRRYERVTRHRSLARRAA